MLSKVVLRVKTQNNHKAFSLLSVALTKIYHLTEDVLNWPLQLLDAFSTAK